MGAYGKFINPDAPKIGLLIKGVLLLHKKIRLFFGRTKHYINLTGRICTSSFHMKTDVAIPVHSEKRIRREYKEVLTCVFI